MARILANGSSFWSWKNQVFERSSISVSRSFATIVGIPVSVLIRIECKGQIWDTFHCPAAIIFSGIPHPRYRRVFSFKLPLFQRPRGRGSISCASVCKVVLVHYRERCLWLPRDAIANRGLQACPRHTAEY